VRIVFRGFRVFCVFFSVILLTGGCAVFPGNSDLAQRTEPVAQRDVLADAVGRVEKTPWPKPQTISFLSRISGGGDKARLREADSIATYLDQLKSRGPRFQQLLYDASINLAAAERLEGTALKSLTASRLSKHDVALVETAIQALRANWQIYSASADELENFGEVIDDNELDALHDEYRRAIKGLGKVADRLAEEIDRDRTKNFATHENFSGL